MTGPFQHDKKKVNKSGASISSMPSRRSTQKPIHIMEREENTVLPLQNIGFSVSSANNILKQTVSKRKKHGKMKAIVDDCVVEKFLHSVTDEDRKEWKGWCELESEPAFFNVMLRDFGVKGIKVQEIYGLDEESLSFIPKPVYGLIFLSQFKDDCTQKQEATCPEHIWFANQTISNACASIALLNIVMNLQNVDLGPMVQSLKDFTTTLNPALRGYQVCNHDFIRQIHNSFSRKMDMLNADLALFNDVKAKKGRKKAEINKSSDEEQEENGFHFVAFVPIQGTVWKLDGLDRQPTNLGAFDTDWMEVARPFIQDRMLQYEGNQIRFNLVALCKSPLLTKPMELATNIQRLRAVESRLNELQSDWQQFLSEGLSSDDVIRGPDPAFQINRALLHSVKSCQLWADKLYAPASTMAVIFHMREELIYQQQQIRADIVEEIAAIEQDNERALCRRHDYTPLLHTWMRFLAENGFLEDFLKVVEQ